MNRLENHKLKIKIKGFTLIEVIVALSIFALLSLVGYKGLSSLILTKDHVMAEDEKWQQLVLFFDRIELDVKQSVNRPVRGRDGSLEPAWVGRPYFAGEYGAQLVFSRFGDSEQAGFLMDTRRVGYRLHDGAVELLIWPALDLAPNTKPEVFKVLPHVTQITFSYLTDDGRLLTSWPENVATPELKSFAPAALKIAIKFDSGELITRTLAI